MLIYKGMNMIKFIKSFFTKKESKFEHPLDAVTKPNVPVVETPIEPVVETPAAPVQKKKRQYKKKTK